MSTPIASDLRGELHRLDLLLHREILRLRAAWQLSQDEFRGLYVSDERVDHLVSEQSPAPGAPEQGGTAAGLTRDAALIADQLGDATPLGRLARDLGLSRFERDVVLLALAPEVHLKYEALYAYLNDHVARRHPTVDLALRLFAQGEPGARALLARSSRLFADGLVETIDSSSERRPELATPFVLGPALAAVLLGMPASDARLAAWAGPTN